MFYRFFSPFSAFPPYAGVLGGFLGGIWGVIGRLPVGQQAGFWGGVWGGFGGPEGISKGGPHGFSEKMGQMT